MNWVSISIIILTVLQRIVFRHIKWRGLAFLVIYIVRALFLFRIKGIIFKLKPLWVFEGLTVLGEFLYAVTTKNAMLVLYALGFALISGICVGVEFLDDKLYVYHIEDYNEDDEED